MQMSPCFIMTIERFIFQPNSPSITLTIYHNLISLQVQLIRASPPSGTFSNDAALSRTQNKAGEPGASASVTNVSIHNVFITLSLKETAMTTKERGEWGGKEPGWSGDLMGLVVGSMIYTGSRTNDGHDDNNLQKHYCQAINDGIRSHPW